MEEVSGVPFDHYMALGAVLYLKYFQVAQDEGDEQAYWTPESVGEFRVEPQLIKAFVSGWSEERHWFRSRLGAGSFPWDFTPLRQRPMLRHGGDVAPFSAQFLLEKGTDGIFYTVMDYLRSVGRPVPLWTNFFGRLWERYVSTLLDECVPDRSRVITEEQLLARQPGGKVCDRVVMYPGEWLLIEAVSKRITLPSAATGGWEDLERDLALAVAEKARQLAGTVERLSSDPEAGGAPAGTPMRFRPVVVLPGPFPNVPPIINRLRETILRDPECRALGRPGVDALVVLDAKDYELLLGSAEVGGRSLVELLGEWQASGWPRSRSGIG